MSELTLRSTKGSPLTNSEIDGNFTALNNDKQEAGDITYEALDDNSDVGSGADQVAKGDHNHSGVYQPVSVDVVAGHIRAGNTQIIAGVLSESPFGITDDVTENSFETVGPTGSGATNIWTAMDNLPSNATILICRLKLSLSTASSGIARVEVYATEGDLSASVDDDANLIGDFVLDYDVAVSGVTTIVIEVLIPLESNNQDFRITWITSGADMVFVYLFYKGFMTD